VVSYKEIKIKIKLTTIEKRILAIGLAQDYLDISTFYRFYKSAGGETINRFITLGLITSDIGNKFKINKDLIIECLS